MANILEDLSVADDTSKFCQTIVKLDCKLLKKMQ